MKRKRAVNLRSRYKLLNNLLMDLEKFSKTAFDGILEEKSSYMGTLLYATSMFSSALESAINSISRKAKRKDKTALSGLRPVKESLNWLKPIVDKIADLWKPEKMTEKEKKDIGHMYKSYKMISDFVRTLDAFTKETFELYGDPGEKYEDTISYGSSVFRTVLNKAIVAIMKKVFSDGAYVALSGNPYKKSGCVEANRAFPTSPRLGLDGLKHAVALLNKLRTESASTRPA